LIATGKNLRDKLKFNPFSMPVMTTTPCAPTGSGAAPWLHRVSQKAFESHDRDPSGNQLQEGGDSVAALLLRRFWIKAPDGL
jgi:hypothetical protein